MTAHRKPAGRLYGGLSRIRARLADRARLVAFLRRERPRTKRVAWAIAEGVIGGLMGLLMAAAWIRYR